MSSTTTTTVEAPAPAPERKRDSWPVCAKCGLAAVPPIVVDDRCTNEGACRKRQVRGPRTVKRKVKP